jgi:hypothetical protein
LASAGERSSKSPMRGAEEAFQGSRRFDLLGRLGDGGGGVVYRARDRQTGRQVALKLMRDREGDGLERFRADFEALRRLAHPNLVGLLDLIEERGRVLLVMELVEGSELLSYVRSERGFDEARLRESFRQLAQALHRLHAERRVHRDVKSSNIRVTAEGRVVLLDLDFALEDVSPHGPFGESDTQVRPAGTALYMAPEQAASGIVRAASDWYALGVVLYEALTGILPCRGSDIEVLLAKQDGRAVPPCELNPRVPTDLNDLCMELLSPAPDERPNGPTILRRLGVIAESAQLALGSALGRSRQLFGRDAELAQLEQAFERARGHQVVLRVSGVAGAGKSAVCAEFVRRLESAAPDTLILESRCSRYPDRPHAPFREPLVRIGEALMALRGHSAVILRADAYPLLAKAFPEAFRGFEGAREAGEREPPDPLEQRIRCLATYRALLSEVADARPVVFWLDDFHLADADSQRLLAALTEGEDAPHVLFLLGVEPNHGPDAAEPGGGEWLSLPELVSESARALIEHAIEGQPARLKNLAASIAGTGNPLSLEERLRHAALFGALPDPNASLNQLILHRVNALTGAARDLLEIVSAAHDPLPVEICERASELSRSEFARECSLLEAAGFLRRTSRAGEEYLVSEHPLVADCVELELHGARRVEVHRRLAAALIARDPTRMSGRLFRHQGESGYHATAAQNAWRAANEAHDALAFQRAAELFTLGASLDPARRDETGHRRLRRMAEALGHAGWALQAATIYREAALGANSAEALHMRQRAAEHLLRAAELVEGMKAVRELLASIDEDLPRTSARALWSIATRRALLRLRGLRFQSLSEGQVSARDLRRVDALWTSGVHLSLVDVVRGADFLTRGLASALKTGEPHRVARALCTEAWMRGLDEPAEKHGEQLLEMARELAEAHPSPFLEGHIRLARGIVAFGRFHLPECHSHFRDAEQVFRQRCTDVVWEVTAAQVFQLVSLANMARYEEQAVKLAEASRQAQERGDLWGYSYFMSIGAMGTMLAQDRPEEAFAQVQEGIGRWASGSEFHFQHWVALIAAVYIDLYLGRASAFERIDQHWDMLKRVLFLRLPFARMALHELRGRANVLAYRQSGEARSIKAAEADARVLLQSPDEISVGLGHLIQANIAQQRRNLPQSIGSLRAGIALLERRGLDMWVLAARAALGSVWKTEEGTAIKREAERILVARGVRDLERWRAMLMPGFVVTGD